MAFLSVWLKCTLQQIFNRDKARDIPIIYGVVTTGSSWKFMQLEGQIVTIDSFEYFIDNIRKIMAILLSMARTHCVSG